MNQFRLLGQRRFAPFFAVQALAAFNDNVLRNAVIVLVGFQLGHAMGGAGFHANLALALFILPFLLFSASAGQLADKFPKPHLIRAIKLFEVAIAGLAAWSFFSGDAALLLVVLFLMGLHSTLFGPIKYAILPQVLTHDELVGGNALVASGSIIAILLGMMAGGTGMADIGPWLAAALVVGTAVLGLVASFFIPRLPATAPKLKFNWNPVSESWRVLKLAARRRAVWNAILGISWFWFFGGVITTQLPNYSRAHLGGDASVTALVLALFAIGLGAGALLCERLSGHKVEIGLVPLGALGMTVFGVALFFADPMTASGSQLGWLTLLQQPGIWCVVLLLGLTGLSAGLFVVPLFALVQNRTPAEELARVVAGNNILNALLLVVAAIFGWGMLRAGLTIPQLFLVTAILNAMVTLWIFKLVPEFLMRFVDWLLISLLYHVHVDGLENVPKEGPALLVCNHVSFMDALIIMGSVRRPVRFVMYYKIFRIPVLSFVFRAANAVPIAGMKEDMAMLARAFDSIDDALADGELVCIFPEGRLTADGEMNPFRSGVERVLERRVVPVIPMALRGLWHSMWSRRDSALGRSRLPRRFRADVELVIGQPMDGSSATRTTMQAEVTRLRGEAC